MRNERKNNKYVSNFIFSSKTNRKIWEWEMSTILWKN